MENRQITEFWKSHDGLNRQKRRQTFLFAAVFAITIVASGIVGEVSFATLAEGIPGFFNYISDTIPIIRTGSVVADVTEWYWGIGNWIKLLWDTLLIAFVGSLLGTLGAFAFCFPASRNLARSRWSYFFFRRMLEFARTVPELVYAMIFVFAFGLGPLAGVLAIAVHTLGALGKLFSEVNENVDDKPLDGVRASGGNWLQMLRFAVVPQVLPNFLSYSLLRFEINVRSASVIGFVGAGGIGQELYFVVRQFVYTDISAIVLMIVLTVVLIDLGCERLRHRFIAGEAALL